MRLTSPEFEADGPIPVTYSRDGENVSPPLEWSEVPPGAAELALVMENISGTPETAQWVVYHLSPRLSGIPKGFKHSRAPSEPVEALQGTNDFGNVGYDGPLGTVNKSFRHRFQLFALDAPLDLPAGADRKSLERAMSGHILEAAELTARYERPKD